MAMYYWDSEMFRRSSAKRRKLEGEVVVDNKKKLFELLKNPMYSDSKESQKIKIILQRNSILMTDVLYRDMCNIIIGGDPKSRAIRALYSEIGIYYSGGKR